MISQKGRELYDLCEKINKQLGLTLAIAHENNYYKVEILPSNKILFSGGTAKEKIAELHAFCAGYFHREDMKK